MKYFNETLLVKLVLLLLVATSSMPSLALKDSSVIFLKNIPINDIGVYWENNYTRESMSWISGRLIIKINGKEHTFQKKRSYLDGAYPVGHVIWHANRLSKQLDRINKACRSGEVNLFAEDKKYTTPIAKLNFKCVKLEGKE